jgi:hypothetical protein
MRKRRQFRPVVSKPITLKGRIWLSVVMLLAALVLGFATSVGFYQITREYARNSDVLGRIFCGEGQHIDDVASSGGSRRMICRDAAGAEVGPRNNLIAVKMGLPFILLYGSAGLLIAWTLRFGEVRKE